MPINFPGSSFFESIGNAGASFTEIVRDELARHACTIWSNYPAWITEGTNPGSSFARGFMNRACAKDGFTPPSIEVPDFTGGQCCDVDYNIRIVYSRDDGSGNRVNRLFQAAGSGAITAINFYQNPPPNDFEVFLLITNLSCAGVAGEIFNGTIGNASEALAFESITLTRIDGLPDDCGDLPSNYPVSPPPTINELDTTIVINDVDSTQISIPVRYNRISADFNFPLAFDVGGIAVTIDLSGMTFHGDPNVVTPTGDNPLPSGDKDITNPDGSSRTIPRGDPEIVIPEYPVIPPIDVDLEWLVCESGVIESVSEVVKLLPGTPSIVIILLDILGHIIEEICKLPSDVGVPEVYPVLPGAQRPVIMYYYKEFTGNQRGASTFTSSLPNPNPQAIAEIPSASYPDRHLGNFVYSLKLLDGSRLVARGVDAANAEAHLNFLIARVQSNLLPGNVQEARVLTQRSGLDEIIVKCTQVEYYPNGKDFARNPSEKRLIQIPEE